MQCSHFGACARLVVSSTACRSNLRHEHSPFGSCAHRVPAGAWGTDDWTTTLCSCTFCSRPQCGCLVVAFIVTFPRPLLVCHSSARSQPPRSPMGGRESTLVPRRRASQEETVCRGSKQQQFVLLFFCFENCQGSYYSLCLII